MFKKIQIEKYPRRQWSLVGAPSVGKSTFSTQMRGPILTVDSDHRYSEVAGLASSDVYELSSNPSDNMDPERIRDMMKENMPSSGVKTIVVDSITSIISPLVVEAMMDNDAGRNKNRVSAFKDKALAMRVVQDAVTGWGVDTLWVLHTRKVLDANAKEIEVKSISPVELARLRRSLNMELKVIVEGNKRGIRVEWARNGRSGMTIWDTSGKWTGMPEKIEAAVYDGLSAEEMAAMEKKKPTTFFSVDAAISWAFEQGCFKDAVHTQNAYDLCKKEKAPKNSQAMWDAWIADVERRVAEEAGAPLNDKDSAPVLDKRLLEDENGDYLFKAPDKPIRIPVVNPTADTFEDIMAAADMFVPDENGEQFMPPSPFQEFFSNIIVRMTPEMVVLSDILVYGEKDKEERVGQSDVATVDQITKLSTKLNAICGDESYFKMTLGEIVLRLLAGQDEGLPSVAFAIALSNAVTEKDRKGNQSPMFQPQTVALIKQLGCMVQEAGNDG